MEGTLDQTNSMDSKCHKVLINDSINLILTGLLVMPSIKQN